MLEILRFVCRMKASSNKKKKFGLAIPSLTIAKDPILFLGAQRPTEIREKGRVFSQ